MITDTPSSPSMSHSTASTSYSGPSESKRLMRRKDFQYKYGQKHHSYDSEKAPYPLCYDRHVLELEALDNQLTQYLRGSSSYVPFEDFPQRVLDLGCGTGTWVVNASKEWPDCSFVGFDLVDVQIPLKLLDASTANRIEWKHGNFLTTKLPFEDDEFDHVHIQSIATAVPESKWGVLFEEITRVLRPGGSVEVIEDDTLFPALPRWFTRALRAPPARSHSVRFPDGTSRTFKPQSVIYPDSLDIPSHDHALLESLYRSVFENRFIHMKPSAVLPIYFTTYFRQVTLGPILSFPMPPLAPMLPVAPQIATSYVVEPGSDLFESPPPSTDALPSFPHNRPASLSFSSSISTLASSLVSSGTSHSNSRPRTASAPLSYRPEASEPVNLTSSPEISFPDDATVVEEVTAPAQLFMIDNSTTENESPALSSESIFPIKRLESLTVRSLGMHLYRSYQIVLACQEAMWEELKDRIRNRRAELLPFGWDDDEELEELQSRKKYEKLIERYTSDIQARVSLWCSMEALGWPFPFREPLSKAELIEEERLRECMMEARKQATLEELQIPSRSVRVLVGYNL